MVSISTGKNSKQDVCTPPELVHAVENRFGCIGFDLAASPDNALAPRYFTEQDDSLGQDWFKIQREIPHPSLLWLNPPYNNIAPWAKKCSETRLFGDNRLALLVPASIGANWFIDYVHQNAIVHILKGRVKFVGHSSPFPKDLVLAIYGCGRFDTDPWYHVWDWRDPGALQIR